MALTGAHFEPACLPLDDDLKDSLQRVRDLLAEGCRRHGIAPGTLNAQIDRRYGVHMSGDALHAQQTAFALGAVVGAGYAYNEKALIAHPRRNDDGSLSFHCMHDAMLCAYAFGTPMAERHHSAAVRKEAPATSPRARS